MHAYLCVGGKDATLVMQAQTYAGTLMRGGAHAKLVMQAHICMHTYVGGKDVTLVVQAHTYATHICMDPYTWG